MLVGKLYQPPESSSLVFTDIENSIRMVVDTGISEIIILGDFNLNTLNERLFNNIHSPKHINLQGSSNQSMLLKAKLEGGYTNSIMCKVPLFCKIKENIPYSF